MHGDRIWEGIVRRPLRVLGQRSQEQSSFNGETAVNREEKTDCVRFLRSSEKMGSKAQVKALALDWRRDSTLSEHEQRRTLVDLCPGSEGSLWRGESLCWKRGHKLGARGLERVDRRKTSWPQKHKKHKGATLRTCLKWRSWIHLPCCVLAALVNTLQTHN